MTSFTDLARPGIEQLAMYEPGRPIEEVARDLGLASAESIVKLASNENALGPSPLAMTAMNEAAAQMHRYPDGGAFYLRRALARTLDLQPEQVLVANGSNEIIELMAHVFLGPGTEIVMADRAFVIYRLVAAASGAATVSVPMRQFTHDLDAMLGAVTPRTRIVFVSNPNNPTGTMVDARAVARFMAEVPDHVVVGMDEAYIELLPPERRPDVLRYVRDNRKIVVLRTFSKVYGLAGLRVGYGLAPVECVRLLHRVRQPFNVNAMALAAARAALDDDAHVARTRAMVERGLRFFEERLRDLGLGYVPSVANFILVEVGRGREVFQALQREQVIVRPMDGYGLPDHVRITVGTDDENRMCIEALQKVLAARHG